MCNMEKPGIVIFIPDIPNVLSSAFQKQLSGLVWCPSLPHAQGEVLKLKAQSGTNITS